MQQHWFSDLYAHIDAMRLDDFIAGLTPDVEVVVGNNPAMKGRDQVREGIGQLFSAIDGIKHNVINVADTPKRTFLETNVDYLPRMAGR